MRNKKLMIFGALAIGGLIATAVTTTWGSFKAAKVIQEKQPETKKETVKLVWKYYIPAGIALGTTIIADVCFYRIGMKEIAALTASMSYLTANRSKLEKKLKDVVGEEKLNEIKKEVNRELDFHSNAKVSGNKIEIATPDSAFLPPAFGIQETGYGDTLCRFSCPFFTIWFRSSPEEVMNGIENFKTCWHNEQYLKFVELLSLLHITLPVELEYVFEEYGWPASAPGCCPDISAGDPISIETEMVEGYLPGIPEGTFCIDLYTMPVEGFWQY